MTRIRTLKPEIPQSQTLSACSRDARLLFVYLITQSDCNGNQRGHPALLKGTLFPYDDDVTPGTIDGWLDDLEAAGCARRYVIGGQEYLHLTGWSTHQKISKPTKTTIPVPPAETLNPSHPPASPGESPGNPVGTLAGPGPVPPQAEPPPHIPGIGPIPGFEGTGDLSHDPETVDLGLASISDIRARALPEPQEAS